MVVSRSTQCLCLVPVVLSVPVCMLPCLFACTIPSKDKLRGTRERETEGRRFFEKRASTQRVFEALHGRMSFVVLLLEVLCARDTLENAKPSISTHARQVTHAFVQVA